VDSGIVADAEVANADYIAYLLCSVYTDLEAVKDFLFAVRERRLAVSVLVITFVILAPPVSLCKVGLEVKINITVRINLLGLALIKEAYRQIGILTRGVVRTLRRYLMENYLNASLIVAAVKTGPEGKASCICKGFTGITENIGIVDLNISHPVCGVTLLVKGYLIEGMNVSATPFVEFGHLELSDLIYAFRLEFAVKA